MKNFKTSLVDDDSKTEYDFECYDNTEPIEIGDKFIFFFGGIADVQECYSENEKYEINKILPQFFSLMAFVISSV